MYLRNPPNGTERGNDIRRFITVSTRQSGSRASSSCCCILHTRNEERGADHRCHHRSMMPRGHRRRDYISLFQTEADGLARAAFGAYRPSQQRNNNGGGRAAGLFEAGQGRNSESLLFTVRRPPLRDRMATLSLIFACQEAAAKSLEYVARARPT